MTDIVDFMLFTLLRVLKNLGVCCFFFLQDSYLWILLSLSRPVFKLFYGRSSITYSWANLTLILMCYPFGSLLNVLCIQRNLSTLVRSSKDSYPSMSPGNCSPFESHPYLTPWSFIQCIHRLTFSQRFKRESYADY